MTSKAKIAVSAIVVMVAFAGGRYSVSTPAVKTQIDTQTSVDTDTHKDTHKETTKVIERSPDGTTKTTTTTKEDTELNRRTDKDTTTRIEQTVTPPKKSVLNISGLAGYDYHRQLPTYGVSISKEMIGPVTIGTFGLTNGTFGLSIGVNF